jgi:hypothetical protein
VVGFRIHRHDRNGAVVRNAVFETAGLEMNLVAGRVVGGQARIAEVLLYPDR